MSKRSAAARDAKAFDFMAGTEGPLMARANRVYRVIYIQTLQKDKECFLGQLLWTRPGVVKQHWCQTKPSPNGIQLRLVCGFRGSPGRYQINQKNLAQNERLWSGMK